jgi:hypothetical protein
MPPDLNPAEDRSASDKRAAISGARKDAHAFRGAFLDKYARLERSIAPILLHASKLPEYETVSARPPHLFGQKIAALRKIVEAKGPMKTGLANLTVYLDELAYYDETRNFMSHAVVETALTEHGATVFIFRMLKLASGRAEQATLTISRDEATMLAKHVGEIVNKAARELDMVGKKYQAKIENLPTTRPYLP